MKKILLIAVVCVAAAMWIGGSTFAAGHASRGCFNCHVPHQAVSVDADPSAFGVPLWSYYQYNDHPNLLYTYTMYSANQTKGWTRLSPDQATQPDGASKLCLGCHDGSYSSLAIDLTPGSKKGPGYARRFDESFKDLARTHPISFVYDSALHQRSLTSGGAYSLKDPAVALSDLPGGGTVAQDLLDVRGKMQCTSCHDVHVQADANPEMLRYPVNLSPTDATGNPTPITDYILCRKCHNK
jgi:hypothetical protein